MNITLHLNTNVEHDVLNTTYISQNSIENDIHKYENHSSILTTEKPMEVVDSSFCFLTITQEKNAELIRNLDIKSLSCKCII